MHEYLFKKKGELFGPVEPARIRELLYRGELDASTPVAGPDGAWRPLATVGEFLVDVKKAEAQLRVEREVTSARELARRKAATRTGVGVAGGIALGLLLAVGAVWLARTRPWQKRSALLEDFGGGLSVTIAAPARIGGPSRHRTDDEIDLGDLPPIPDAPRGGRGPRAAPAPEGAAPAPRAAAPAPAGAAARGAPSGAVGEGGDLVSAQYDEAAIQEVISREQRTLAPCLKEATRTDPEFAGDIPVEFAIGNDGRVARLWIDEPRFRSGPLHACMLKVLKDWKFRPFPGQRPTVSLSFRVNRE